LRKSIGILLLASQSPRRRELLALLGLPFRVTAPNVPEVPQPNEPPAGLVVRLSRAKARAAARRPGLGPVRERRGHWPCVHPYREPRFLSTNLQILIIACDTVVALDGELLGKPGDAGEAEAMLCRLRGRSHPVYSAITLLESSTGRTLTDMAETRVTMRVYTDAEIAAYVASGDSLDKAGAYAIQHPGFHPVAALRGCYANVMGLPLCHLTRCLRAWEIEPQQDVPAACQAHTGRACAVYPDILKRNPVEMTNDSK
jgi:septum formation protein